MAAALGWNAARVQEEVASYRAHVESVKSFQNEELETVRAAHA
jgi:hypothetical protein